MSDDFRIVYCENCGMVAGSIGCCGVQRRLRVYTSRITSRDPDRLDITAKSGKLHGLAFAPSWRILEPALTARRAAKEIRAQGRHGLAAKTDEQAWDVYVPAFIEEMRLSYRVRREAWDWLLAKERVVLVCYCVEPERCHRRLLASQILPKLGALDCGEIGG